MSNGDTRESRVAVLVECDNTSPEFIEPVPSVGHGSTAWPRRHCDP
jgi:hypothetical protein